MKSVSAMAALAVLVLPAAAMAADAAHPYANVNRRVDAGNSTGDAQVEGLNQAQLNGGQPRLAANRAGSPGLSRPGQANPYYPYAPPPDGQARPATAAYPAPAYAGAPYAYLPPAYVAAPFFYPRPFFYPAPFFYPSPFYPY